MIAGLSQARRVRVDFACNDDAGDPSGEVGAIQIGAGEPLLDLEAHGTRRLVIQPARFVLDRRAWPHLGQVHWVGSMVWEGVWMAVDQAAYLLGWIHARRHFSVATAESTLFQAWNSTAPFGGGYLHEQLATVGRDQEGR